MKFGQLVKSAHENAVEKGFWEKPREFGTLLALIHSELSEALEADRHGDRAGVAEEIADAVIRLGDMLGGYKIDLGIDSIEINRIIHIAMQHPVLSKAWNTREFGTHICTLHLVLSRAFSAHLNNMAFTRDANLGKFVAGIAFACGHLGIDLEKEIEKKMEINRNRPRLHGKTY